MDFQRLHECLHHDYDLLRAAVAGTDPAARVPSCPDWTVTDLARHVAEVYQHKAECIRQGAEPQPWPPARTGDVVADLDSQYALLEKQFATHSPASPAPTWAPEQTVGFWIRRMTQETVIHRIDAELAAGGPMSPVPDDLAVDGIDELLTLFLAHGSVQWREYLGDLFAAVDERPVVVRTTGRTWTVSAHPDGIMTTEGTTDAPPAAEISGEPAPLLLWLWNRAATDTTITVTGDETLLTQFHTHRVALT